MDIRDEHALQIIKNVYGGSIKLRAGANALRYRLHHKSGLLNLIRDVNGEIRNSNRLIQLNKICGYYYRSLTSYKTLCKKNQWLHLCGNHCRQRSNEFSESTTHTLSRKGWI